MSFMFNPYPYDDMTALNKPHLQPQTAQAVRSGNRAVIGELAKQIQAVAGTVVVAVDGYAGAEWQPLVEGLCRKLSPVAVEVRDIAQTYRDSAELQQMLSDYLPEDRQIDPVLLFGKIFHGDLSALFSAERLQRLQEELLAHKQAGGEKRVILLVGCGSACVQLQPVCDLRVFLDVTPLQTALRVRAGKVKPLGDHPDNVRGVNEIFRRLYYFDYELLVAHRQELIDSGRLDYYIDANRCDALKMLPLAEFRLVLQAVASMPFRCKPVYLEGVWGGFFIKKLRHLPTDMKNCAWVFDLIPNEVSLLVKAGAATFEIPYPTFFRAVPQELMGEESVRRFGTIFPIRFNYDDTYAGGGNMSVQVHPGAEYARSHFGEPFQQDESYYVVETAGSKTYLGLRDEADAEEFFRLVRRAETEHEPFDYERFINYFESRKGDQYLLPGGTVHASGWNQVVLEIGSCTVGSYTFKMYDYLRKDLDGNPRPIHSQHGEHVLDTSRRRSTVDGVLRPSPRVLREGNGWRELLVGEHPDIFFSLRRLEFDRTIEDDTEGKFHVLVLVEGEEVLVCSREHPERYFRQKFCDMVVVPASLGRYCILNLGDGPCKVTKTLLK